MNKLIMISENPMANCSRKNMDLRDNRVYELGKSQFSQNQIIYSG